LSNRRLALFLVVGFTVVGLLCAFGLGCKALRSPAQPAGVEIEDCDAEDFRNKEAECGFSESDRRKTPAPRPKTSTKTRR
jgi:hypothetical protein